MGIQIRPKWTVYVRVYLLELSLFPSWLLPAAERRNSKLASTDCVLTLGCDLLIRPCRVHVIYMNEPSLCDDKEARWPIKPITYFLPRSMTYTPRSWNRIPKYVSFNHLLPTPVKDTHSLVKKLTRSLTGSPENETAFRFGAGAKRRNRACEGF